MDEDIGNLPAGVPQKIALGCVLDVLDAKVEAILARARPRKLEPGVRPVGGHTPGGQAKAADSLRPHCARIGRVLADWAAKRSKPGGDIDAAVFGYVMAVVAGHSQVIADLRLEFVEVYGEDPTAGVSLSDISEFVLRAFRVT